jgi:hypothetical protein
MQESVHLNHLAETNAERDQTILPTIDENISYSGGRQHRGVYLVFIIDYIDVSVSKFHLIEH